MDFFFSFTLTLNQICPFVYFSSFFFVVVALTVFFSSFFSYKIFFLVLLCCSFICHLSPFCCFTYFFDWLFVRFFSPSFFLWSFFCFHCSFFFLLFLVLLFYTFFSVFFLCVFCVCITVTVFLIYFLFYLFFALFDVLSCIFVSFFIFWWFFFRFDVSMFFCFFHPIIFLSVPVVYLTETQQSILYSFLFLCLSIPFTCNLGPCKVAVFLSFGDKSKRVPCLPANRDSHRHGISSRSC